MYVRVAYLKLDDTCPVEHLEHECRIGVLQLQQHDCTMNAKIPKAYITSSSAAQ